MKIQLFLCSILGLGVVSAATINLQPGNPDVNEVLVSLGNNVPAAVTILGNADGVVVQFTSDGQLLTTQPGNGLAFIRGVDDALITSAITVSLPGYTFGDISFNAFCQHGGSDSCTTDGNTLVISAVFADHTSYTFTPPPEMTNGENRYTAYAVGSTFTSVTISSLGFSRLEQVKLSEIAAVPEPGTVVMLVSGLAIVGAARWRRRRVQ
jgi:hypothetical protein